MHLDDLGARDVTGTVGELDVLAGADAAYDGRMPALVTVQLDAITRSQAVAADHEHCAATSPFAGPTVSVKAGIAGLT